MNNPDIDVDALMTRVHQEVLRRQFGDRVAASADLAAMDTTLFDSLIEAAAQRASLRSRWPARLGFFPFNVPAVRRFALRTIAWLFRDQHAFNAALIQALRESVTVNVRLAAATRDLEARVRRLEERD
ncbi:MAG TPA: hypothetical protein VGN14_03270 [Candidatus Elarobacter sp.]